MSERAYQRLTRSRTRRDGVIAAFATRSSLWLAKDHLLCVDSTGYSETYRRFYFRDIQTITLELSNRLAYWNWVLGGLTLFFSVGFGIWFFQDGIQIDGALVAAALLCLFVVLLILNNLLGPTCRCFVRTAVQLEELPSLCRLRSSRKVLERLRPLITTLQGQLSPEEIERKLTETQSEPPIIARMSANRSVKPPQPYQGPFHHALCWMLIADLPLTALSLTLKPGAMDTVSVIQFAFTVVFAIVCLAKQHESDLSPELKRLPWLVLGASGFFLFVGVIYAGIYEARHNGVGREEMSAQNNPVMLILAALSTCVSLVLGVLGLFGLRRFRLARGGFTIPPPALPNAG